MSDYTKTTWVTGDLITAERMNNIEDGIEDIVNEINGTIGGGDGSGTLWDKIDDMIQVSPTQPSSSNNEIWFKSNESGNIQVPTYDEFQALIQVSSTLPTSTDNKIWFNSFGSTGTKIPTYEDYLMLAHNISTDYTQKPYELNEYCLKDNILYKCTTAITTAEAWNPAHWEQTTITTALANLNVSGVVRYSEAQSLTASQQAQARANIGAVSLDEVEALVARLLQ